MKKVKIAHVLHSVGGVDVSLRLILQHIDPNRFESFVVHGNQDTTEPFLDKQGQSVRNYKTGIVRSVSPIKDLWTLVRVIRVLFREKPDLIHAHSAKGGIIGRMAGRLLRIPVVYTPQAFSYLSAESSKLKKVYLAIEKFAKGNSILLASSESERQRGISEVGFKPARALLFNNGVAPIGELPEISIPKTWPDEYICTVGRPSFQKNIELMIDVLHEIKKTKDIHLVIMGVGHHSDKLDEVQQKIEKYGLQDCVTLLAWTQRSDIFNIVAHSKLYISTARYEGLPYSIIESLALGIPAVVSDCDGNRDLITDAVNGFVIKDGNPKTYSTRVLEILNNPVLHAKMSESAKMIFEKQFNIVNRITDLEEIYANIASS